MSEKTKEFCMDQVRRLKSKPYFNPDAVKEIARTLFQYAETNQHMERVIDAAILRKFGNEGKQEDRPPSPHDIWALCREIPPTAAQIGPAHPDCPHCNGTAWETVERNGVEGVKRCRCGGMPRGAQAA